MPNEASVESAATAPAPGLLSRFVGVIFSPRQTFLAVAARPTWLGIMALSVAITAGTQMWFMSTDVGRRAMADQSEQSLRAMSGLIGNQERLAEMQEQQRKAVLEGSFARVALLPAVSIVIATPIFAVIIAGLLYLIFGVMTGGSATFKQVFSVVAHAGAVSAVGALFVTPLNYVRESMSSATNLSVFVPGLPEGAFLTRLLGTIDLFMLWWLFVLAIGIAVVYKRRTQPVATTLFIIYGVIALAIAGIGALISRGAA